MKRLCITYRITTDHSRPSDSYPHNVEVVETCVILPMLNHIADDILAHQEASEYVRRSFIHGSVLELLVDMAELQGYRDAHFISAEEVNK